MALARAMRRFAPVILFLLLSACAARTSQTHYQRWSDTEAKAKAEAEAEENK